MIRRFCLYGFLKNQQYFEPFLVLIFLEKGLSFFQIGLLIAIREITVNLLEIASGAVADVYGRRRAMITSFSAYIASFLVFGTARSLTWLILAMILFGVGESFRTGTHKAMIFAWLKGQGRIDEKTAIYGKTRSWSKLGSATSVLIAAAIVLASDAYSWVFFLAIIPYSLGIINFIGYQKDLDGTGLDSIPLSRGIPAVAKATWRALRDALKKSALRRLMLESMGFEGLFRASKDYLQPVLQATAVPVVALFALQESLGESQQSALLVGPVYFFLYLLSAAASRNAHRLVDKLGSEDKAASLLWFAAFAIFALLLPALFFSIKPAIIVGFILLFALQNLFRPVLISRIDTHGREEIGATIMSVENQAKSLSTMLLAPIIGASVDATIQAEIGGNYWPIGALGFTITLLFLLWSRHRRRGSGDE